MWDAIMLVAVVVAFCALAITYSRIDRLRVRTRRGRSEDNRHVAPHSLRRPLGSCASGSRPRSRRFSSQCRLSVGGAPSVPIATMIRSQVSAPSVSPSGASSRPPLAPPPWHRRRGARSTDGGAVDVEIGDGHSEMVAGMGVSHIPIPHTDGQGHSPSAAFSETIAETR
jgi:hypothetical protein